jgi:hypothetical protein
LLTIARLPPRIANVTVHAMYTVARFLQIAGLTIPPLAIMAQLNENISLGKMLQFLVAAIALFSIGYLLQSYSTGKPK